MSYAAWEPRYRVTTVSPGKLDLFVLSLIDGRRAAIQPILEYDEALAKARAFHRDNPRCQIKVLPLTGTEASNLLGTKPGNSPEAMGAADQKLISDTLMQVARGSSDDDARRDALDLLAEMGVLKS